jgi:hypothetical protein
VSILRRTITTQVCERRLSTFTHHTLYTFLRDAAVPNRYNIGSVKFLRPMLLDTNDVTLGSIFNVIYFLFFNVNGSCWHNHCYVGELSMFKVRFLHGTSIWTNLLHFYINASLQILFIFYRWLPWKNCKFTCRRGLNRKCNYLIHNISQEDSFFSILYIYLFNGFHILKKFRLRFPRVAHPSSSCVLTQ